MKLALALVVVMSTWVMLMFAATSSEITKPKSPPPPPPSSFPKPETAPGFNLKKSTGDTYSKFIGDLRGKVKDPTRAYFGVPMIRKYPRLQYMYVALTSAEGNSVTLAIRMSDLYVDGYSYTYRGQLRARFLKLETTTIQQEVEKNLFPDAKNTGKGEKDIGYDGSYGKLEGKAGVNRMSLKLGSGTLETYINEISQKDPTKAKEFVKTEAKLLLIVIQMVSEAVRFKYIEDKIKDNFSAGYAPDSKAINLENNWENYSKAIVKANQDGTNPGDIINDMGLLKYLDPAKKLNWPMMQAVDNVTVWAQ